MPRIVTQTNIQAKREIVFDLSRSIDLHKISTSHTKEEAIAGVTTGLIGLKESVTWKAKHFGIYQKLTSKITAFRKPVYFTDEMERGIFKRFEHQHLFAETDEGTLMTDIFDYESPLGYLGKLADTLFLKRYLKKLIEHRNQIIKDYAEGDQWKSLLLDRS